VFERFSSTARQVVVNAQEQARGLGHSYIGTEHELLGLLSDTDSTACQVLNASGVTLDGARERVLGIVGRHDPEYRASGRIPFTARAKAVLESAMREALRLGHQTITPEHLLLGLTSESEGVAIEILVDCGTSTAAIRERLLPMLPDRDPVIAPARDRAARTAAAARPAPAAVSFSVSPDRSLQSFLMFAAGRALSEGRDQFGMMDLLDVLVDEPEARGALAELGIEQEMVRAAIRRARRSEGPPEAQ